MSEQHPPLEPSNPFDPSSPPGPADSERDSASGRSRLLFAWLAITALGGLMVFALFSTMLRPRDSDIARYGLERPIVVGKADTLLAETDRPMSFENGRIWVVALDGGLIALSNLSPHLGCRMDWKPIEERFIDPCHGQIHHRDGSFEKGPTQRDMHRLPMVALSPEGKVVARSDGDGSAGPLAVPSDSQIVVDIGDLHGGATPDVTGGR